MRHMRLQNAPDADEVDVNVHRERLLEFSGLCPSPLIVTREHVVRKGDLLMVRPREESNLVATRQPLTLVCLVCEVLTL